jgi:hypothetical protein
VKRAWACVLVCTAFSACAQFDHLNQGGFELDAITLPAGTSVALDVWPVDTDGDDMACDVALVSTNQKVMLAERAIGGATVVSALTPGKTSLKVYCDGDAVGTIPGEVTPELAR